MSERRDLPVCHDKFMIGNRLRNENHIQATEAGGDMQCLSIIAVRRLLRLARIKKVLDAVVRRLGRRIEIQRKYCLYPLKSGTVVVVKCSLFESISIRVMHGNEQQSNWLTVQSSIGRVSKRSNLHVTLGSLQLTASLSCVSANSQRLYLNKTGLFICLNNCRYTLIV